MLKIVFSLNGPRDWKQGINMLGKHYPEQLSYPKWCHFQKSHSILFIIVFSFSQLNIYLYPQAVSSSVVWFAPCVSFIKSYIQGLQVACPWRFVFLRMFCSVLRLLPEYVLLVVAYSSGDIGFSLLDFIIVYTNM